MTENVKNENYIHIPGFMVKDLGLKGNELLIYAIIYGFSQLEGNSFNGNLQYLADWTNSTKQGVLKNLKSLMEKNLIVKETVSDGVLNKVSYHATKFNGVLNKVERGVKQSLMGDETKFNAYNIYNNNILNNSDIKGDIIVDNKKDTISSETEKIDYQGIVDMFNNTCVSLPKIRMLTDDRKAKIKNRLKKFDINDLQNVFIKAEKSNFLSGRSGNWKASFDWFFENDMNMVKVLEGNYDNNKNGNETKKRANSYTNDEWEQA